MDTSRRINLFAGKPQLRVPVDCADVRSSLDAGLAVIKSAVFFRTLLAGNGKPCQGNGADVFNGRFGFTVNLFRVCWLCHCVAPVLDG